MESTTYCSHLVLEGQLDGVAGVAGEGADGCVRPGAIHHARLTGIFKDKKPSAAAIHQL